MPCEHWAAEVCRDRLSPHQTVDRAGFKTPAQTYHPRYICDKFLIFCDICDGLSAWSYFWSYLLLKVRLLFSKANRAPMRAMIESKKDGGFNRTSAAGPSWTIS